MIWFPSGSRMSAMWQTPVSNVSMSNWTPCSSSSAAGLGDVGDAQGEPGVVGAEREALILGLPDAERHLALPGTRRPPGVSFSSSQAEELTVEPLGPGDVLRGNGDEVDLLDTDHSDRLLDRVSAHGIRGSNHRGPAAGDLSIETLAPRKSGSHSSFARNISSSSSPICSSSRRACMLGSSRNACIAAAAVARERRLHDLPLEVDVAPQVGGQRLGQRAGGDRADAVAVHGAFTSTIASAGRFGIAPSLGALTTNVWFRFSTIASMMSITSIPQSSSPGGRSAERHARRRRAPSSFAASASSSATRAFS